MTAPNSTHGHGPQGRTQAKAGNVDAIITDLQTANSTLDAIIKGLKPGLPAAKLTEADVTAIRTLIGASGSHPAGGVTPPPDTEPVPPDGGPTPPGGGTLIAAGANNLRTAINGANADDTFEAATGSHTFNATLGYDNSARFEDDGVTLVGQNGTIITVGGVANGLIVMADHVSILGLDAAHPMILAASPSGTPSDANGSGLLAVNGQPASGGPGPGIHAPTTDLLVQDLILRGASVLNDAQHLAYLSGQLKRITFRRVRFEANGSHGFGLHDYHVGAGASEDYLFEDCTFVGFGPTKTAALLWNPVNLVTFRRCNFIGTTYAYDVRAGSGGTVRFESCTLPKGVLNEGATIVYA